VTLALDASAPAVFTTSTVGTVTSASCPPPAGSLLVVCLAGNSSNSSNPNQPTITDSRGTPLTYTLRQWRSRVDAGPQVSGQVAIWTAPVTSSAAMTVSITTTGTSVVEKAARVWVFTGQDTTDPIGATGKAGSQSATAIAQNYTAESTGGWGVMSVCDWDATGAPTAGSGCTLDGTGNVGSGQISYCFPRRTTADDVNTVANTLRFNPAASSTNLQFAWIEINPAAASGTAHTVTQTDSAGLTDTSAKAIGKVATDSVGLTDAGPILTRAWDRTVTDSAGLTDTSQVQAATLIVHTDSAGLTDTTAMVPTKVHTDSVGRTDGVAKTIGMVRTDSAGLSDPYSEQPGKVATDSVGLTDGIISEVSKMVAQTDSVGLTDTATVEPTTFETATDSVGLTDGIMTLIGSGTIFLPGGLVPVRALSEQEILTGNRMTSFRYDLYSQDEAPLGTLTGVVKGSVDFSTGATIKSGGALDVVDVGQTVNWLSDRVRPVAIIEGLPEIPLGMFLFSEAPQEWDDTGRVWEAKLLDKLTVLDQDAVDGTYSLDAGTVITTAVVTVIASSGETNYAITPSAATLAAPLSWEAGTAKLRIVNDLLAVAGYFSLWCDGNGQYRGEPYVRPAARPIRYEFLDGATSIYSPEFVIDVDLFAIPNKFVAVGQGSGDTEALISVATNEEPDSPYSFAARGRWIVASATGVEAADQDVLDAYARRRLIELTSPTASVDVRHALVPDLTLNNAVRLRRVPAGVDARHVVTKMAIALDPTALVKTTLVEVVDL